MKVSLNWLKDYVDVALPVEELAEKLTMAGLEVKSVSEGEDRDKILDIEVTPNRPDCLSVQGIAREVAAVTGCKLQAAGFRSMGNGKRVAGSGLRPKTENRQGTYPQGKYKPKTVSIEIQDKQGCLRYTGRVITNIKVQPSPQWMQRRLLNLGLRPINNVVDITNYVMLEMGQPLHAFDFEKIKGVNPKSEIRNPKQVSDSKSPMKKIIIRRAKKGEKIITLDGEEKELDEEILVIADSESPLAIAGLIGGENSGIDEGTNTILLESAHFKPSRVRKASRKLAISTESSYRFERGVNLEGVDLASERASELLEELAQGKSEEIAQAGEEKRGEREVELRYKQVRRILGIDISEERIKEILGNLQFEVTFSDREKLRAKVPYFRSDIEGESDLLEEIARIFGFQNIPRTMPKAELSSFKEAKSKIVDKKVKEVLISSGFEEVISNSLISKQALDRGNQERRIISIANPLSAEQEIMRPLLFFNALNILAWNLNHQAKRAKIFELGKVYYYGEREEPCEDEHLAIALFGNDEDSWRGKKRLDFYELKGAVEKLLLALGVNNYLFVEEDDPLFSHLCAALKVGDKKIGVLGKVNEDILAHYDLREDVYLSELGFKQLVELASFKKEFEPILKYPSVRRDIALLVREEVKCKEIVSVIRENGGELINNIYLFDIYQGEQVPKGYKSLAFSIEYQGKERTLTDAEINSIDGKIRHELFKKLGATGR